MNAILGGNTWYPVTNEKIFNGGISVTSTGSVTLDGGYIAKKLGGKYMENLYNVIIVNKNKEILLDTKVVGKSQKDVEFDVSHRYLYDNNLKPDDVTVIIKDLGSVEVEKELCTAATTICSK